MKLTYTILFTIATLGCTPKGEAIEASFINRAARTMDKAISICDFVYTRGASFGAIERRFLQDPETASAYLRLFHNSEGLDALIPPLAEEQDE